MFFRTIFENTFQIGPKGMDEGMNIRDHVWTNETTYKQTNRIKVWQKNKKLCI